MTKFADYQPIFPDNADPKLEDFKRYSVAWVIQRVVDDVRDNPELKQIGESKGYILRALQRCYLGDKDARKLTRQDVIEFGKWLRKRVCPATAMQHVGYLSVTFDHANSTWEDCELVTRAPIEAAAPYLRKHNLVGKSTPRKQRPTEEQIAALKAYALKVSAHRFGGQESMIAKRMPDMIDAARVSSRRLGELCRITHGDIDYEGKTYWVRDLKHPTKKKGNDKQFILWPDLEAIFRRQPRLTDDPNERIFPLRSKSVSAWYTRAKKPGEATEEGIENLHFHDNRRDAISAWLLKGLTPDQVRKLVSGHETVRQIEQTYDGRETEEMMRAVKRFLEPAPMAMAA